MSNSEGDIETVNQAVDEFYYVLKMQARNIYNKPVGIWFLGKTVAEFKKEIFCLDVNLQQIPNIDYTYLEIIYKGGVLDDKEWMEYVLTSSHNPMTVFIPTELSIDEYKNYMTVCLQAIDVYKR